MFPLTIYVLPCHFPSLGLNCSSAGLQNPPKSAKAATLPLLYLYNELKLPLVTLFLFLPIFSLISNFQTLCISLKPLLLPPALALASPSKLL